MNLYYLTNILLEKFCEKIFKAKKKPLDSIEIVKTIILLFRF